MWMNQKRKRSSARVAGAIAIATLLAGAGCAGEQSFPAKVPVEPHASAWVDGPLDESLRAEQSRIGDVLAGFLASHRAATCQQTDTDARPSVQEQAQRQASARVMHAHSRAELVGEKLAMSGQSLGDVIDLTAIAPFDEAGDSAQPTDTNLLKWQCDRHADDRLYETVAQNAAQALYTYYFGDPRISRSASMQVLPALRRDLEWGLPQIVDATDRRKATATITEQCRQGESPLGNYLIEHADADDDRLASLARRLGGKRPCDNLGQIYHFLIRALATQLQVLA
jgi:hypothetical protein